jgi:hypothetical protein
MIYYLHPLIPQIVLAYLSLISFGPIFYKHYFITIFPSYPFIKWNEMPLQHLLIPLGIYILTWRKNI